MFIVKKSVFYCDFCRKYKLTSYAMKVHEKHCTMNPDRVCRMTGCCNKSCPICEFAEARQSGWKVGRYGPYSDTSLEEEIVRWRRDYVDSMEAAYLHQELRGGE